MKRQQLSKKKSIPLQSIVCSARNIAAIAQEPPVSDHSAIYTRPTFLPQTFLSSAGLSEHI